MTAISDPALQKFRAALEEIYGERLERVVLYGSRARGGARPDSDYDVAIFLQGLNSRWDEIDTIIDVTHGILVDTGALIHAMPFKAGAYQDRTPLMHELRREGKDV
jgi:predicted nucleotidyltransferase